MSGEAQRLEVRFGFEDVGQAAAAGQRAYGLSPLAQRADQGGGELADGAPDGAGQGQGLGDIGQ